MTSIIKFTVLSGAKNESPPCYLLQVDNFRFLLDCGWDESFSMKIIDNIKKYAVHYLECLVVLYTTASFFSSHTVIIIYKAACWRTACGLKAYLVN